MPPKWQEWGLVRTKGLCLGHWVPAVPSVDAGGCGWSPCPLPNLIIDSSRGG